MPPILSYLSKSCVLFEKPTKTLLSIPNYESHNCNFSSFNNLVISCNESSILGATKNLLKCKRLGTKKKNYTIVFDLYIVTRVFVFNSLKIMQFSTNNYAFLAINVLFNRHLFYYFISYRISEIWLT